MASMASEMMLAHDTCTKIRGPTHPGPRAAGPEPTPQLEVNSLAPAAAVGA